MPCGRIEVAAAVRERHRTRGCRQRSESLKPRRRRWRPSPVQEQVEQVEGRNHTYPVGKCGAHCAIGLAAYHAHDLAAGVTVWLGRSPSAGNRVKDTVVVPDRAGIDSLTARRAVRVVLWASLNEEL